MVGSFVVDVIDTVNEFVRHEWGGEVECACLLCGCVCGSEREKREGAMVLCCVVLVGRLQRW